MTFCVQICTGPSRYGDWVTFCVQICTGPSHYIRKIVQFTLRNQLYMIFEPAQAEVGIEPKNCSLFIRFSAYAALSGMYPFMQMRRPFRLRVHFLEGHGQR